MQNVSVSRLKVKLEGVTSAHEAQWLAVLTHSKKVLVSNLIQTAGASLCRFSILSQALHGLCPTIHTCVAVSKLDSKLR